MKTLVFVDDEVRILQGQQRQLRPMRNEWDMHFFESGPQALEFMAQHPVDVIVTDMMMPGMDGAQLLTQVAQRHPNVVRMVLSGQAEQEAVLRLVGPAHQYLSKPCTAEELRHAIVRAFALRDLLGSESLKQLTAQIESLPTTPASQSRLVKELMNDNCSLERVGEIVTRDIGMSAKILQLVNSAFFGLPGHISNPTEAVSYLGLGILRALVFSADIFSKFDPARCPGFALEHLEQHSWDTALMARRIAHVEQRSAAVADQCFLAALLHDVGQLVLAAHLPAEYARTIARARTGDRPIWTEEQEQFGASHADVGAYLLGLWGLPDPVVEAVAYHHTPGRGMQPPTFCVLAVHVADGLAHEHATAGQTEPPAQLDLPCLAAAGLADRLAAWREACQEPDQS